MSTQYEPIQGLQEQPIPELQKSEYFPAELHISRFYGGVNRGVSIQLGINNESEYHDIQLDNKSALALLKVLQDALEDLHHDTK